MFHPMDPLGGFLHQIDRRLRSIETRLNIDNIDYTKNENSELLDISVQEVEDIVEKQKNIEYNSEWNGIVKGIKKAAENGTSPIVIYFNIKKFKKELMEKLEKLGFELKQRVPETPKKDAVSYIITIKKND